MAGASEVGDPDAHQQPIRTTEQAVTTDASGEVIRKPQDTKAVTTTTIQAARPSINEPTDSSRNGSQSGLGSNKPAEAPRFDKATFLDIDCLEEAHQVRTGETRPR